MISTFRAVATSVRELKILMTGVARSEEDFVSTSLPLIVRLGQTQPKLFNLQNIYTLKSVSISVFQKQIKIKYAYENQIFDPEPVVPDESHCTKVQKYKSAKQVSNFLICGANNVVEPYGKTI